ncbi:hypothetical protein IAQ61_010820 [Plenodomus lingam]|uniref:uncharacterized protein n=1 Tax=Leptosphaeria maculans TaxID=5022 RepID=UPI00332BDF34|nr:hypothetical protein IAQ61_010820 [Plenodomus lingam]
MFAKASVVTFFASLAAAQLHAPVGQPSGNAITRPLNEIVPACKPFTITWNPSTPNTVSVLLLKGPATNVVKHGPSLAEGIANSGSLAWTPSSDLEATTGPNGYGIQIIDDVTGQYQYSTQFGISKDGCAAVSSAPAASPSPTPSPDMGSGYPTGTATPVVSSSSSAAGGYGEQPPASHASVVSSQAPVQSPQPPYPTPVIVTSVGPNGTVVPPTGGMPIRPTSSGNSTASLPEHTGAAAALQAGLSFVGAAAVAALML